MNKQGHRLDRKPNPDAGWSRDSNWNLKGKWLYKEEVYDDDGKLVFQWVAQSIHLCPTLDRENGELAWRWTYHSCRGWPNDYPNDSYCDQLLKVQPLAEAKAWAEAKLAADEEL